MVNYTVTKRRQKQDFEVLYHQAHTAGMDALNKCKPTPMIVLDDSSPVQKQWFVREGVCGFAWIRVRPANCAFARWALKENLAGRSSYAGSILVWVHEGGQSLELKTAYANAFASVLVDAGINAHSDSRID